MKKISLFFGVLIALTISAMGQYKISDGINFSQPLQIDSSNYFVFGGLMDKANKCKYSSGGTDIYNSAIALTGWTNLFIYNAESKHAKKLFSINPVLIYPVTQVYMNSTYYYGSYKGNMNSAILKDCILIATKTDEFNKDGIIDEDDPVYLFISSKDGSNIVQITPKDVNITTWQLSKDGKTILVLGQKDKNGDKKFSSEDEMLFQIDLSSDFSKIKMSLINL